MGRNDFISVDIKSLFFDRPKITNAVNRARRVALSKGGALVRAIARNSIRRPRRMRLSELPPEERAKYQPKRDKSGQNESQQNGTAARRTKLPFASSKPGEPPRNQTGTLKRTLFFAYDSGRDGVVVGPASIRGGNAPNVLEFGGVSTFQSKGKQKKRAIVEPRPFMGPALKTGVDSGKIADAWAGSVQG